jgi:hypothetical protein
MSSCCRSNIQGLRKSAHTSQPLRLMSTRACTAEHNEVQVSDYSSMVRAHIHAGRLWLQPGNSLEPMGHFSGCGCSLATASSPGVTSALEFINKTTNILLQLAWA